MSTLNDCIQSPSGTEATRVTQTDMIPDVMEITF